MQESPVLPNAILSDLKDYLDITWSDPATDRKLEGILLRGILRIDEISGAANDYKIESTARELLFDYVRYVRAGALDEFESNYLHRLLALQINTEVPDDTEQTEI